LTDVVLQYSTAPQAATGQSELKPLQLSESEVRDLVAFLGVLN
jgi:cytochrome c peroxidase